MRRPAHPAHAVERALMRAALSAILAGLACEDPDLPPSILYREELETDCGGLPCGVVQTEGAAGQARWVETDLHPGEHGVRLDGSGVTIRATGMDGPKLVTTMIGTLEGRLVGRCDRGASLRLAVAVEIVGTGVVDESEPALVTLAPEWDVGTTRLLTLPTLFGDAGLGGITTTELRVVALTLSKTGPGSCDVAQIIVDGIGATTLTSGTQC